MTEKNTVGDEDNGGNLPSVLSDFGAIDGVGKETKKKSAGKYMLFCTKKSRKMQSLPEKTRGVSLGSYDVVPARLIFHYFGPGVGRMFCYFCKLNPKQNHFVLGLFFFFFFLSKLQNFLKFFLAFFLVLQRCSPLQPKIFLGEV